MPKPKMPPAPALLILLLMSGCSALESLAPFTRADELGVDSLSSGESQLGKTHPQPVDLEAQLELENQQRDQQLLAEVLARPALPGAPEFEKRRAELVSRAKGEPVLFIRTPEHSTPTTDAGRHARARLDKQSKGYSSVRTALRTHRNDKAMLRELLLREGYLYSEVPAEAFSLVRQVSPQHLFSESELWIHRGEQVLFAQRKDGYYVFTNGPQKGERASLMHLDRIGTGEVPEPLHRDLRALKYRAHFDQVRPLHLTTQHLVVELRYGVHWVKSVLRSDGAKLELQAEFPNESLGAELEERKRDNASNQAALQTLRETISAQVAERLPFDEPKTEFGQEDGALRRAWHWAYRAGHRNYEYNLDLYPVFTAQGQPRVPQVCIDFVVDSLERASGTWWGARSEPRKRKVGGLDLRNLDGVSLRRTNSFVELAEAHPEWFDVRAFEKHERIQMGRQSQFFASIERQIADFQAGDIIFIRGFTPWDEEKRHTHSFIIYETDPISQMPILVAGNAGPANLWSWEAEARRTPKRTIRHRIRPRKDWLRNIVLSPEAPNSAPSLLPTRPRKAPKRRASGLRLAQR